MKIYYIYQITNLVNNKIYVGVHETSDLDDGYMGSGKVIRAAIKKYGIDNFKKDILEFFDTSEAMYAREKEIVTEEFLLREDVYNLRRGGTGGFDYINKNELYGFSNRETSVKAAIIANKTLSKRLSSSKNAKILISLGKIGIKGKGNFTGKKHTEETKNKIRLSCKGKQEGYKNSQFGTIWINNGSVCKKIKKEEPIPDGWNKGRRILVV